MLDLDKLLEVFFTDKPAPKEDWERVYKSMIVHTRGVKPKELLEIKRPNEPEDIRKYRLANYRAITKHGINQAIDAVYRVLSSSNYAIVPAKTIDEYIKETKFNFLGQKQDFHNLFFKTILRIIFDDPNGLLVWMPENANPDLPPIEQEETTPINVYPLYVCSKDIKHLNDDVAAFVGGKMVVLVPGSSGNKPKEEKHDYYFICTKEFIYRYVPYWDKGKKKVNYQIEDWYNLSLTDGEPDSDKEFPSTIWHVLGGNVAMNEHDLRYYDSFYGCYVPFGDECICAFSDNSSVRVRYNFPFVEAKGQVCVTCKGAGKINKETGGTTGCTTCNGGGKIIPFSPHGHYINEPPTSSDNPDYVALPAIRFYSPDVAILKESYDTWEDFLNKAKETVNLLFIDEAQSGIAKEYDREQKYETLIKINQNFFGLNQWSLDIIQAYKVPFADSREENKVTEPESFSIKTEGQLITELNDMTQKETPIAFIATTSKQIADKLYANDDEAKIIARILPVWDVLYGKSAASISQYKANGGATQLDVLRNIHGYSILSKMALVNDLGKMKPADIITKAEAELQKLMPKETLVMPVEEDENTGATT